MDALDMKSLKYIKKGFLSSFLMVSNSLSHKVKGSEEDFKALRSDVLEIGNDMRIVIRDESDKMSVSNE